MKTPESPSFGALLQRYRKATVDKHIRKCLSQGRFAEKLSKQSGLQITRNKVGYWEANKTPISANDRNMLMAILIVLHQYKGITEIVEADELLEVGEYRRLNEQEKFEINPTWRSAVPSDDAHREDNPESVAKGQGDRRLPPSSLERMIFKFQTEFETILADARMAPGPSWSHVVIGISRRVFDHFTAYHVLNVLLWIWLWIITWLTLMPSLRWPFASQEDALFAMVVYSSATLLVPLFIALLTQRKSNGFWREQKLDSNRMVYWYIYQGAGIGFSLGYFAAFVIALLGYHLRLPVFLRLEALLSLLPLLGGYIAAPMVPYSLWRAYGRLKFQDGGIFFLSPILFGPVWGLYFLNSHGIFLAPLSGLIFILLAVTCLAAMMVWLHYRTGDTIIPVHWWVFIYGSLVVLYEISIDANWFHVISLGSLIVILGLLLSLGRIRFTLTGIIVFLACIGILVIVLNFNLWLGRILTASLIAGWWHWRQKLAFPPASFWVLIMVEAGSAWALEKQIWPLEWANAAVLSTTFFLVWWEYHLKANR
jgi:hypothetical protein